jgi:hypothetical protein
MLSKLIGRPNKRETNEEFLSILIDTPKRLETLLNHRKQSTGAQSNRNKNSPPFKSRSSLPSFEGAGRGNSAKATETSA